jgi:segregation and condensation protein A
VTAIAIEPPAVAGQKPSIDLELDIPAFSGPLALLLELIERRKLPITEISIAQVADQYLERMRQLVGVDPEILADFLVIAARLLLLKSRELLPSAPIEVDEPDVAAELQQRLLEYRIFREAAEQLRQLEESDRRSYTPQPSAGVPPRPEPPLGPIPPEVLRAAMIRMLKALQRKPEALELSPQVTVADRIEHLIDRLTSKGSAVFSELAGDTVHEIVATFLALLELLRRGIISAEQDEPFADIRLSMIWNVPPVEDAVQPLMV